MGDVMHTREAEKARQDTARAAANSNPEADLASARESGTPEGDTSKTRMN